MLIHCEESATTKTAPFRRNPLGAGGPPTFQTEAAGAPQALSFVGHDEMTSFRSSLRACNPKTPARGPRDFCHGLLKATMRFNHRHPRPRREPFGGKERGISLLEVTLAMGIVALLGATFTVALPSAIDSARDRRALIQLQNVKEGLIGQRLTIRRFPDSPPGFGYIGDMGTLPASLAEIVDVGAQPNYLLNPILQIGAGWRGPYITTNALDPLLDPWGNALVWDTVPGTGAFSGAPIVATIRSMGPDGTDLTPDDLSLEIHTSEAMARLFGFAIRSDGTPMAGMQVDVVVPVSGILSTTSLTTDAGGFYDFSSISHGDRIVRVQPGVELQPGSVSVFGGSSHNVRFTVENLGSSALSITSLTANYPTGPQAFYRRIRVNGVVVHNVNNPRAGDGDLVTFAPQAMAATTPVASTTTQIRTGTFQVPDLVMAPPGGSLLIRLEIFRQNQTPPLGPQVNMSGVTFSVLFSDGSTVGFTTP